MDFELDKDAFATWLQARADKIVGRPGRTGSCPLATYLRRTHKAAFHVCYAGGLLVVAECETGPFHRLPEWATDFVEAFDTTVERGPTEGAVALAVLQELD